mmetsp:Transcript_30695/g.46495  ORF Transcript_30695/g.46495 Transcript_30695/m.46495 type:complete len:226 (-) Transcript_30695:1521-2198(-)
MNIYRPTKRQKREAPISPFDVNSLEVIASPFGVVRTLVSTPIEKEIILNRLKKEIVESFELTLSVPRLHNRSAPPSSALQQIKSSKRKTLANKLKTQALKSRLYIGVNQGTRALERKEAQLLILCNDVYKSTILQHVIKLIKKSKKSSLVPIVLLPGNRVSFELGEALGVKRASSVVFTERPRESLQLCNEQMRDDCKSDESTERSNIYHDKIDSFLEFCKSKLP